MKRQPLSRSAGSFMAVILIAWGTAGAQETVYQPGGDYIAGEAVGADCGYGCDGGYGYGCADACCGSGCCDAGCCDTCCSCCCQPCCCGWYAGAEVVWAEPRIKDNNAFSLFTETFGDTPDVDTTVVTAYDYDYEVTPRLWIGYTNCCGFGIRGSWWEFDDDADSVSVVLPDDPNANREVNGRLVTAFDGQTFSASQRLELELADLEFTNDFNLCGARVIVGYGLRYVRYASDTLEQVVDTAPGVLDERGRIFDRFDGVGPTVSLEFIRPITCNLSAYGNLRGTVAFGERETTATEEFFNAQGMLTQVMFTTRTADEPQAIGEIQLGVQWSRCCWFVRVGWQAQYWDDATEVESVFNQTFDTATLGDIGVQGFNITVGYGR